MDISYLRVSATNDSFFSAAEDLDIIQDVRSRTRGCSVSSNHNNRSHIDTVPKQLQRFFISSHLLCEYYKHYTSRVVLREFSTPWLRTPAIDAHKSVSHQKM